MTTETRTPRHPVRLPLPLYETIRAVADELGKHSGAPLTTIEVIGRAVSCLVDSHTRGAWLSPEEAQPVQMERVKRAVVEIVAAIMAHTAPELGFRGVGWDDLNGTAVAVFADGGHPPIAVQVGEQRPEVAAAPTN